MIKGPLTLQNIEKAATESCVIDNGILNPDIVPYYENGFKDGAQWRINSIWHDCCDRDVMADNKEDIVLLLENGMIVDYEDNWEEHCSLVLKWAYKKDLLPINLTIQKKE